MNTRLNDVSSAQADLMACLQRQEQHYAAATAVILKLQKTEAEGRHSRLAELQKHLAQIRTAGLDVQRAEESCRIEGRPRSVDLSRALASQETRLKTLLDQINRLQEEFRAMKDCLQPQLDSDATRRSMHQAYQRSMRTG